MTSGKPSEPGQRWESKLALMILFTTPFIISLQTFDSYLLPKYLWLSVWACLWISLLCFIVRFHKFSIYSIDWLIGGILLLYLLSIGIRYRTPIQIRAFLHVMNFVVLYLGFRRLWEWKLSPVVVARILMATVVILSLYGLLQDYGIDYFHVTGGVRDWRAKVIATLGNPNFLAGYLAISLPVIISYALRPQIPWWDFIVSALVFFLAVSCLIVTFSVGATTALVIAALIGLFSVWRLSQPFRIPIYKILILLSLSSFSLFWYLSDNPYNSHHGSLYREAWRSPQWWSGMGSRLFNWRTTRLMINDQPIWGIGFGNYLTVHELYQGRNYQLQGTAHDRDYVIPVDQPHFQLLETAAEIGPLGVFGLLWLLAVWFRSVWIGLKKRDDQNWFAWGAFLGVMVAIGHSFSDFPFHLPASSLLIVVLVAFGIAHSQTVSFRFSRPKIIIVMLFLLTLASCVMSSLEFIGNHYLRLGIESRGFQSMLYLEKARQYDPFSHLTYLKLGTQYAEQGWERKAMDAFEQSLRYQEDHETYVEMSRFLLRTRKIPEAVTALRRVLELNPAYPGHYRDLAFWLKSLGNTAEAERLEITADQLQKQLDLKNLQQKH